MLKKLTAVFSALALSFLLMFPASASAPAGSYGAYKHVVIIGVDGAGTYFEKVDTPNFDRIFASGAVRYNARTELITVSAQNWGAMLTGVSCFNHGFTNDSLEKYERTSDTEYPSIFTIVHKAMPEAKLASVCNWSPINYGIIEKDIGADKINPGDDAAVADALCGYFNEGNKPALLFVQFDSVDGAGHEYGRESQQYADQIKTVDGYIGRVYDCMNSNGMLEDTLFIVVADHGHKAEGGHGGLSYDEAHVMLAVSGKTVIPGADMTYTIRNRDVAAIALYALGIEQPSHMTAVVPGNLFTGVGSYMRPMGDGIFVFLYKLAVYGVNALISLMPS